MKTPRWQDIKPGTEPPARVLAPISRTDIVRYQGASGDMQPIHHDEPFARAAGYEAPLVVGMFPAGVLTTWATDWLGPQNVRRTRLRWKAPVWPGDVLSCSGKVVKTYREEGAQRVDLELSCEKQDGQVAVLAWMTFVIESG